MVVMDVSWVSVGLSVVVMGFFFAGMVLLAMMLALLWLG
jgi:hypothetical protein